MSYSDKFSNNKEVLGLQVSDSSVCLGVHWVCNLITDWSRTLFNSESKPVCVTIQKVGVEYQTMKSFYLKRSEVTERSLLQWMAY